MHLISVSFDKIGLVGRHTMPLCAVAGGWGLFCCSKKKFFFFGCLRIFSLQGIEPMSHLGGFPHWGPLFCNVTL